MPHNEKEKASRHGGVVEIATTKKTANDEPSTTSGSIFGAAAKTQFDLWEIILFFLRAEEPPTLATGHEN